MPAKLDSSLEGKAEVQGNRHPPNGAAGLFSASSFSL